MAVFKVLAAALLVATLTQVTFAAPTDTTEPASRPAGPSSDPKKAVETINPRATAPAAGPGVTPTRPAAEECPGTYNADVWMGSVKLLETTIRSLEREAETPERHVIEALGEDNVRRLHQEFATAAAGFRELLPDARRLATEENLPCNERKTIFKRIAEKKATFYKMVADASKVLALKVREELNKNISFLKKGREFNKDLRRSADHYDNSGELYLVSYRQAERERVAAAKFT